MEESKAIRHGKWDDEMNDDAFKRYNNDNPNCILYFWYEYLFPRMRKSYPSCPVRLDHAKFISPNHTLRDYIPVSSLMAVYRFS